MVRRKIARVARAVASAAVAAALAVAAAPAAAQSYKLGPEDSLRLRVVEWLAEQGRFDNWGAVSGDYRIGADGRISVPLAGALVAEGLTTAELADTIASELDARVRSDEPLAVSIEVLAYRPFFIIGDVGSPGRQEFSPNMTAMQAYALAGGGGSVSGRQSLLDKARLQAISAEITRARIREARLVAEIEKRPQVAYPETLSHPEGAATLERLKAEESAIFQARRASISLGREALVSLQALLSKEGELLEKKLVGIDKQIELVRQNVANIQSLVDRGLGRAVQLSDAQRALIQIEGRELDARTALFRSQERLGDIGRDLIELESRREIEASTALQQVRATLERLSGERNTLLSLPLGGVDASGGVDVAVEFFITRVSEGGAERVQATAGSLIAPGDVLEVRRAVVE